MRIRIRPPEIEIPKDDPFRNDLLDRKPAIEALSALLGEVEGPCVVALDSEWGGGKSTFLKIWAAHLKQEGFPVAEFNAWETDFSGDPFVALSSHLQDHFTQIAHDSSARKKKRFAEAARKVAARTAPAIIRLATSGIVDASNLLEKTGNELASYVENRLDAYREAQQSVDRFRVVLQAETLALSERHEDHPFFVMIDELDRCRPSYAVELLEVAKHLFSVDGIIFVLAVNRSELAHAVKVLYGAKFDADGYLHRFFDLDYKLTKPDREKFVLEGLRATNLDFRLQLLPDDSPELPTYMVTNLLARSDLDLRRIGQTLHRLALVSASEDSPDSAFAAAAAVTVILRALDLELYTALRDGGMKDAEIIGRIYEQGDLSELKATREGILLEALIALAWAELSGNSRVESVLEENSALLSQFGAIRRNWYSRVDETRRTTSSPEVSEAETAEFKRASRVIDTVRFMIARYSEGLSFRTAAQRAELLPKN